ncbi:hypothetical protein KP509_1Z110100 [Ceratopteris richardii]|nr:hypothetical protein KP509_1Z110100 [Ceratopteris richardii]
MAIAFMDVGMLDNVLIAYTFSCGCSFCCAFMTAGMFDNVLSDYLWAKAVLLTSTTAATAGLSVQVPIAAVIDSLRGIRLTVLEYVGGLCVLVGFFGINEVAAGCCNTRDQSEDNYVTGSQ